VLSKSLRSSSEAVVTAVLLLGIVVKCAEASITLVGAVCGCSGCGR